MLELLMTFEVIHCASCGMPWAMTANFKRRRKEDGASFYCPAGHAQHFADPDIPRLEKQLEEAHKKVSEARRRNDELLKAKIALEHELKLQGGTELPEDFPHRWQLRSGNIYTFEQLAARSDEELLELEGIGPRRLEDIREAAQSPS